MLTRMHAFVFARGAQVSVFADSACVARANDGRARAAGAFKALVTRHCNQSRNEHTKEKAIHLARAAASFASSAASANITSK